ncbi:MAG: alginate lyase family protein [Deferribacteres bacterium]|nr:alginate lyase family protein [Deferribacteres bacterium]
MDALKKAVIEKRSPVYTAFEACRMHADQNLDRTPSVPKQWYVPGYYNDAEGHKNAKNGLRDEANAAYAMALCYRVTGQEKYARSAVRIINAWATEIESMSRKDDSMLSFSYHFPALIFAADLLRDEISLWPKEQQEVFSEFLRNKALPMNTMSRENNWGNWGLVLAVSCAAFLKDEVLFAECAERWKYFIEHQIAADGHLPHEVKRSEGMRGIWYSHFSLMPQTIAAEILRVNGMDLYDYTSPSGHTLKQAYEKIAGWTRKPDDFPYWKGDPVKLTGVRYFSYFEILNAHWPNDDAAALLTESRPMTATHSAPFLTFTHGISLLK